MVVALHSGSTTRFEMGDDAFTTNMSLLTTVDLQDLLANLRQYTCIYLGLFQTY